MRTAIDTIAIEMIVPADDALLPTLLASIEVVGDGLGELAPGDTRGDFDGTEVFGVRVGVGVGVGVGECDTRRPTTTAPVIPAWIEQWYGNTPCARNRNVKDCCSLMVPESNEPSSAVTV